MDTTVKVKKETKNKPTSNCETISNLDYLCTKFTQYKQGTSDTVGTQAPYFGALCTATSVGQCKRTCVNSTICTNIHRVD